MHAVVVKVTIHDDEGALSALRDRVAPWVSQAPGFVTGHWTRKDNGGLSMIVFDSEDAANAASELLRSIAPDEVTQESVEVREVVAHA